MAPTVDFPTKDGDQLDTSQDALKGAIAQNDALCAKAKAELHEIMSGLSSDLTATFNTAQEFERGVVSIGEQLDQATHLLTASEPGAVQHYVDSTLQQQQLEQSISVQSLQVQALAQLSSVHEALSECDRAMKRDAFDTAAKEVCRLTTIVAEIRKPACPWRTAAVVASIADAVKLRRSVLTQRVTNLFWKCVRFEEMSVSIKATPVKKGSHPVPMSTVVKALTTIDALGDVVDNLCKNMLELYRKVFPDGSMAFGTLSRKSSITESFLKAKVPGKTSGDPNKNANGNEMVSCFQELLSNFQALLQFVLTDCLGGETSVANYVQTHLWSQVHHEALSKYVLLALPRSGSLRVDYPDAWSSMLTTAKAFDTLTTNLGLTLSSFAQVVVDVDVYVAANRRNSVLGQARAILLKESFEPVKAHQHPPVHQAPSIASDGSIDPLHSGFFHFPECNISEVARDIMSLIYGLCEESMQATGVARQSLLETACDVVELFRAIVPTRHAKSIETVPQITALHHNDCMYIAHHLLAILHSIPRDTSTPSTSTDTTTSPGAGDHESLSAMLAVVPVLRDLAETAMSKQIARQVSQLKDVIASAEGFADVSQSGREMKVSSAFEQLVHQYQHLSKVWPKGLLPETVHVLAMGAILNDTLEAVVDQILEIPDVGAEECTTLQRLCKTLVPLQAGLRLDNTRDTKLYVESWSKFVTVTELVDMDMAGIKQMVEHDALRSVPKNQLTKLLTALFEDTSTRRALIKKIESG